MSPYLRWLILINTAERIRYDTIYLLIAVGLTSGGSSTVHINTQKIHRTIQWSWISQMIITRTGFCPAHYFYLISFLKFYKYSCSGHFSLPLFHILFDHWNWRHLCHSVCRGIQRQLSSIRCARNIRNLTCRFNDLRQLGSSVITLMFV